ncbi:protein translocase subunit SecD [Blautia difficilis]|uniref:Multifunctional fusion protein n=1 Tax=Blautia difficilis TaxID=2763027 RepID=A0ABR7IIZ7_9FIRM|nr:protein translocase subunit SecD [Blautia difficilis]MBC5779964.1 protein translocase subunit SecD [Blautia difficilis]
MKKSRGIVVLLLTVILTVFFCFTAAVGIGPTGTGAAKHINTGLDLSGGVSITYQTKKSNPTKEEMSDTKYKLQKRVEQYSTEAQVYQEGTDRITVEIPGVTDADAILNDLGKPGSLYFITQEDADGNQNFTTGQNGYVLARSMDEIKESGSVVLEGSDVADAEGGAIQNQSTSAKEYVVSLTLTSDGKNSGKEKFSEATKENVGKQIAIIYDNQVVSAPNVNEQISGGKAQISGMKDLEEAQNLASYIRIGSLSLELEELRSSVVAAQLGEEAISTSVIAGAIGLIIVILFMIIAYRVPGIVAGIALILYTVLMLITLNAFDITLTLPGIAGIILGIGMAVDANVIIYARIREEIGAGVSVRSAIKAGFSKAFSAIFDGNITTLIAAFVLMWLGSGTVKGFAYTLALGIVISMFTSLVVSRLIVNALYAVGIHDPKFYGNTKERKAINFVGKRKVFFIVSIILILSGPAAMLINSQAGNKALNYSLEFSGGTSTTVTFNEDMDIKTIDSEVTPVVEEVTGDKNVQPTKVVGTNQVVIKTRSLTQEEREALQNALVEKFGVDENTISTESISSTVSKEMRQDAIVAVIVATICMLLYIWFRFKDICFASSAVLALLHDVLVVLAFYAIARISVGNTFIACMLTIVGYSINATIVIFDRIRENMHGSRRIDNIEEVVNSSITQTLTRSIYTSFTTFVMVAVLYIMGVSSIREFAAPLMVGILVGAYSSVCVTGALWLVMKKNIKRKGQPAVTMTATGKTSGTSSVQKKARDVSQKDPAQPKKKNRKRVAERLAAQEAAQNKTEDEK